MKRFHWLPVGLVALCLIVTPLAGCVAKCEYRDFSSPSELQDWLLKNNVSEQTDTTTADRWYSKALQIQEDALKEGYIVSADYDYDKETALYMVYCVTIIDGDIWYWDPETDEPYVNYSLGKVK